MKKATAQQFLSRLGGSCQSHVIYIYVYKLGRGYIERHTLHIGACSLITKRYLNS